MDDLAAVFEAGVYRAVLGTAAVRNPDLVSEAISKYGCSRVVVGIDAKGGEVKVQGWEEGSGVDAVEMAVDMEARGVRRIIYTDIARDGMLNGPNLDAYREMGRRLSRCRLTASGGVSDYRDLIALDQLDHTARTDSVVVGRALYENRFPCQAAWCWNECEKVDLDTYSTARLAPPADLGGCE